MSDLMWLWQNIYIVLPPVPILLTVNVVAVRITVNDEHLAATIYGLPYKST